MKRILAFAAIAAATLTASVASAGTMADVKARGKLNCGVTGGQAGFSAPDASGAWKGMDVDYCRAIAAAVLKDPNAVNFIPTTAQTRFTALASGEIDILSRTTTWTFSRDVDLKFSFAGVNYYDGQAFMVPKSLGITSAKGLNGATVCIQTGTTTELNLAEYFRKNSMKYEPVPVESNADVQQKFLAGGCDVTTSDGSDLASTRSSFKNPGDYVILPEVISKEPLGPLVRQGDDQWADLARWTLNALVSAEELGVTAESVEKLSAGTDNPDINRLLGKEDKLGEMLGLDAEWAKRAIAAEGNYGEMFARNLGDKTPIGLARGLNALWTDGGLMYGLPLR
ncbi:amino acid ABC transporter substrate-binding protein [Rhizobium chutanense]|uniref:Amino acid ABC transporter substrate-binding protein n=1 Tax=Rhizobium chutanense TaxID=2035448 RepID=A0A3S0XWK0_9HYPH|nr:amino acid ABC transporter substrate-binding protein [Rhizobium chutanense]RUM06184.1 amino acid ABC transporter substrate-binding protein [Rhizobium chutanense]